jgi:predicted HNH restriction endonuclease
MPYKDPEIRKKKHKEYSAKHYEANKEVLKLKLGSRKRELKANWSAFKSTLKCTKCGFSHPAALDFHHTDPSKKDNLISKLVSNGCFKKAREEALKCIVLCANCHRIHHHEEKKNPAL